MSRADKAFQPVTKAQPCLVCDGDHKCSRTADGLLLCGRTTGPVPGFAYLGPAKNPTSDQYCPVNGSPG